MKTRISYSRSQTSPNCRREQTPFSLLSANLQTDPVLNERLETAQSGAIEGVQGWRFLPAEIKHLLAGDPSTDAKKPLEAIVDFHEQLKRLHVRLTVVPVPPKAVIHPEYLDPRLEGQGLSATEAGFYKTLRANGVEVLDLAPEFVSGKSQGPLYCARDTHWNGRGISLAAEKLSEMLQGVTPRTLALQRTEEAAEIQGDLGGPTENVVLGVVRAPGQTGRVEPDRASPVLLLGDSYLLVFHQGGDMHAAGAGLPDQLAFELGTPIDVLAVRGSGATSARVSLARRARASPAYLAGKKVIIWCFGARELTQAEA